MKNIKIKRVAISHNQGFCYFCDKKTYYKVFYRDSYGEGVTFMCEECIKKINPNIVLPKVSKEESGRGINRKKYLLVYDFDGRSGLYGNYYYAFRRLLDELKLNLSEVRIQRSVFLLPDLRTAKILAKFFANLGAHVRIFEVSREI